MGCINLSLNVTHLDAFVLVLQPHLRCVCRDVDMLLVRRCAAQGRIVENLKLPGMKACLRSRYLGHSRVKDSPLPAAAKTQGAPLGARTRECGEEKKFRRLSKSSSSWFPSLHHYSRRQHLLLVALPLSSRAPPACGVPHQGAMVYNVTCFVLNPPRSSRLLVILNYSWSTG